MPESCNVKVLSFVLCFHHVFILHIDMEMKIDVSMYRVCMCVHLWLLCTQMCVSDQVPYEGLIRAKALVESWNPNLNIFFSIS